MNRHALISFLLLLVACGESSDGGPRSAESVEPLCRQWCTCTNDANTGCLNVCVEELTRIHGEDQCRATEEIRYRSCMIEVACTDPFDDCDRENGYLRVNECIESLEAKCAAECPETRGACSEANGDCELARQCQEMVDAHYAQPDPEPYCYVSHCVRNGGTSCFGDGGGGARMSQ
jgi:hypothetical protein